MEYLNSDFNRFICDYLPTSCRPLVIFGPGFKKGNMYTPLSSSSLATRRHCYTLRGLVLSFLERSSLSFVSHIHQTASLLYRAGYTLGSATHFYFVYCATISSCWDSDYTFCTRLGVFCREQRRALFLW